jgi:hypothetical protein
LSQIVTSSTFSPPILGAKKKKSAPSDVLPVLTGMLPA